MFFVDEPYVSDFFKKTVKDNAIPVVGTEIAKSLGLYQGTQLISEDDAVEIAQTADGAAIYTTSENSIAWVMKHLAFSDLPGKINLFKDKLKFRRLTKSIFPGFKFKGVRAEDLKNIEFDELPLPFIIKPTAGFFSMGVYKVSNFEEWANTIELLQAEMEQVRDLYPAEVLNTGSFFEKPMQLRKIDYQKYPVFGFLFTETREDNFVELENILHSDLAEFVSTDGSELK